MNNTHPLAMDPSAVRLVEHNLIEIELLLDADHFVMDGDQVLFRRRAVGSVPAQSWAGRLGDWLVRDGAGFWRIVSDADLLTAQQLASPDHQRQNVKIRP